MGDVHASRREAATGASCNRASAVLDARGARSFFSRIFSSAAMTRSRAGCVMCSDHPEFRARLQTISVNAHACLQFLASRTELNSKFGGQRSLLRQFQRPERYLKHAAVLPTGRLIHQFRFDVECRFDIHLRPRIGTCSDRLLRCCWPLREIPRSNFQRRLCVGGCAYFASPARYSARCAVSPNREQTIRIGREALPGLL